MTPSTPPSSGKVEASRPRKAPSAVSAAARFGVGAKPAPARKEPVKKAARRAPGWKGLPAISLWPPVRPRLLPATIFVAVLMLGVRVNDVWHAVTGTGFDAIPSIPQTMAQSISEPAKPVEQSAGLPDTAQPPPPSLTGARIDPVAAGASATQAGAEGARADLLLRLSERREELDARARELDQREALLAAAEKSIDQKVEELTRLRSEIEKLVRKVDDQQVAQLESLVKIYETMKPKDAARIFDELDMPVLLSVLERMKESKSAPILASMDPTKAKEITAHLAERRSLPGTIQ